MNKKTLSTILVIAGAVLLLGSLIFVLNSLTAAEPVGLGKWIFDVLGLLFGAGASIKGWLDLRKKDASPPTTKYMAMDSGQITGEGGHNIRQENSGRYFERVENYYEAYTPQSETHDTVGYIPPKTYSQLVGRQDEIHQILGILREPKVKPIIAIVGLGGIGKTTLAHAVVEHLYDEKSFEHFVWIDFKMEHFVAEHITRSESPSFSFDEILNDILRQCTQMNTARMSSLQKRAEVQNLLNNKRILIVLDNLESISESDILIVDILEILGQGKLLITSRHRLQHEEVYTVNLGGFSEDEGVTFLRAESRERGIGIVEGANRATLIEIDRATGGAPLAMKLIIGQMSRQPMEIVLNALKEASSKGQDYNLYRFIYQYSWEMLNSNARMVLVEMSVFPPHSGGAVNDVGAISQVKTSDFWLAMDQLVRLSLVDKIGKVGKERFALHTLTQNFIRSDITKEWMVNKKGKRENLSIGIGKSQ